MWGSFSLKVQDGSKPHQPSLPAAQGDSIEGIYDTLKECACISKSAGGIGLSIHNIRAVGSYIRGTNGNSNGIVPMLRVFNDTARCKPICYPYPSSEMSAFSLQRCTQGMRVTPSRKRATALHCPCRTDYCCERALLCATVALHLQPPHDTTSAECLEPNL